MWKTGLLVVALVGCSSSSSNTVEPTAVDVTIRGNHYHAAQAISSPGIVVLSSATDACQPADAQVQHPGETTIVILLKEGDGPPTGPATFPVFDANAPTPTPPPPRAAILYTTILDANCSNNADQDTCALSGTVTLTAVDHGAYAGKFDVVLDAGERIAGTFDADLCAELPAELANGSTAVCKP